MTGAHLARRVLCLDRHKRLSAHSIAQSSSRVVRPSMVSRSNLSDGHGGLARLRLRWAGSAGSGSGDGLRRQRRRERVARPSTPTRPRGRHNVADCGCARKRRGPLAGATRCDRLVGGHGELHRRRPTRPRAIAIDSLDCSAAPSDTRGAPGLVVWRDVCQGELRKHFDASLKARGQS